MELRHLLCDGAYGFRRGPSIGDLLTLLSEKLCHDMHHCKQIHGDDTSKKFDSVSMVHFCLNLLILVSMITSLNLYRISFKDSTMGSSVLLVSKNTTPIVCIYKRKLVLMYFFHKDR